MNRLPRIPLPDVIEWLGVLIICIALAIGIAWPLGAGVFGVWLVWAAQGLSRKERE